MTADIRLLKSLDDVWTAAKELLTKKIKAATMQTWINPARLVEINDGEAVISVYNDFSCSYILKFIPEIKIALETVTKTDLSIQIVIDTNQKSEDYTATIASITVMPPENMKAREEEEQSFFGGSVSENLSDDFSQDGYLTSEEPSSASSSMGSESDFRTGTAQVASARTDASQRVETADTPTSAKSYAAQVNASFHAKQRSMESVPTGTTIAQQANLANPAASLSKANLSPKYIFDTFVVGSHNRFPYSAAQAVAEKPGQAYNPLFVYGGVGLGKTHLMQAIGHAILKHSPHLSVRYISCERFTNELINSIRDDRMMDFRRRYRQIDVLMVDDIQFIQGKESTQEEFFHTFNALRDGNRQIILSSDRPPKAISHLEERLRSRFEWGLIADIQPPDLETRVAILRKKCDVDNMKVSDEVLEYIATVFTTNIRELEGALIRAHAYASLAGSSLTPSVLAGILQPVGPAQKQKATLTIERITDVTAAYYRVESSELRSSKRSQDLAVPRHVAMYLAHELIQMSFPRIGQSFGNRKHTSALYAHSKVKDLMASDADLLNAIHQIKLQLGV
jgi:chromosomal replication initiator protein